MSFTDASIFIVDPIPFIRDEVTALLKECGFRFITAFSNPVEALELIKTKPCHLILTDWRLEGMTGFDFLKKLRIRPESAAVPFVVLTADSTQESVQSALHYGADDYLLKPLLKQQVESTLVGHLLRTMKPQ